MDKQQNTIKMNKGDDNNYIYEYDKWMDIH